MTPGFRKHLKAHRFAGMLEACSRLFDRVIKLLENLLCFSGIDLEIISVPFVHRESSNGG